MLQIPYVPLPQEQNDVEYLPGPDSHRQESITPGQQVRLTIDNPDHYPGTHRAVVVHIPHGIPTDRGMTSRCPGVTGCRSMKATITSSS